MLQRRPAASARQGSATDSNGKEMSLHSFAEAPLWGGTMDVFHLEKVPRGTRSTVKSHCPRPGAVGEARST